MARRSLQASRSRLVQATDADGEPHGYLASEQNYRMLKDFEQRNLLVPIVGDFAGDKALPDVAQYLREHALGVAAFYVSNVEVYLFNQPPAWQRFYAHIAALPMDERSVVIRSYNLPAGSQATRIRLATVLDSLQDVARAVNDGAIKSYADLIAFVQALDTFPQIVTVRTVAIQPPGARSRDNDRRLDLTIGLRAFLFKQVKPEGTDEDGGSA